MKYKYIQSEVKDIVRFIAQHSTSELYQVTFSKIGGIKKIILKSCDDSDLILFLKYYSLPVKNELYSDCRYTKNTFHTLPYRTTNSEVCKKIWNIFASENTLLITEEIEEFMKEFSEAFK